MYIEVILPLPLKGQFTYFVPPGMESYITEGVLVTIDFNNKRYLGIVYSIQSATVSKIPLQKIKSILSAESSKPVICPVQLRFWQWISEYYFCFIGEVFKAAFPPSFFENKKTKQIKKDKIEIQSLHQLTDLQQNILNQITENFRQKDVCLLHGVPFAGKTELYFHLIEETLKQNKQVLFILPEITTITACIIHRLKQLFENKLGVYHSKLSKTKRAEVWNNLLNNEGCQLILGTRSSVFLPFKSLGLIIIAEEHDPGYKQKDPSPRYHARDAAIFLGTLHQSKVLLGSATPSIESFYNVQIGKYGYARLNKRFEEIKQPYIIPIDTKELRRKKIMKGIFSPLLKETMKQRLENEYQVILFQITSYATEKVKEETKALFPDYSVDRMDLDTAKTKKSKEKIKADFETGKTHILIGTQIIFKELNLERVGLVGILAIDSLMNVPDFRAYERTYQLVSQIIGRIGGKKKDQGMVLLQTSHLNHPFINFILRQDYQGMYNLQIEERRYFNYPPWCRLIQITFAHKKEEVLCQFSTAYAELLKKQSGNYRVLGPDKLPIRKKSNIYFRRILLKVPGNASSAILHETFKNAYNQLRFHSPVQLIYDADPS